MSATGSCEIPPHLEKAPMQTKGKVRKEALDSTLSDCYSSTSMFAQTFLPERFTTPFSPKIHGEMFKIFDDSSSRYNLIMAPRGTGKTTCLKAFIMKQILFREVKYIIYISESYTHSIAQCEDIKQELVNNEEIAKLFGPQKTEEFSKDRWVTSGGVCIFPRGAGQQIRGTNYLGHRPDLILFADLEGEEVESEDQRRKTKKWFFANPLKCIHKPGDWRFVAIGTFRHQDSILADLDSDPVWTSKRLSICSDDYKSNWPEFMSDEDIKVEMQNHRRHHMLDEFCREYMSSPVSKESSLFKDEHFISYSEKTGNFIDEKHNIIYAVVMDPAKSVSARADYTSILVFGMDLKNNKIYFRKLINERIMPEEAIDKALDLCSEFGASIFGYEVTTLEAWINKPVRDRIIERGLPVEPVELKASGKKEERIAAALLPHYRRGLIHHYEDDPEMGTLEAQLLSFPHSKYDDAMDCAAHAILMMEKGNMYFSPQMGMVDEINKERTNYSLDRYGYRKKKHISWRAV